GERDGARGQAHGEGRQHPVTARCERHRDTPSIVRREGGDDHAVCPPVHEPARSAWTPIPLVPTHAVAASGSLTVKADQDGPRRTRRTNRYGLVAPAVSGPVPSCPPSGVVQPNAEGGPSRTKTDQAGPTSCSRCSGPVRRCPVLSAFICLSASRSAPPLALGGRECVPPGR